MNYESAALAAELGAARVGAMQSLGSDEPISVNSVKPLTMKQIAAF